MKQYDVLIVGSGLAGMSLALRLAETQKVALLTKHELLDGASAWAHGGPGLHQAEASAFTRRRAGASSAPSGGSSATASSTRSRSRCGHRRSLRTPV